MRIGIIGQGYVGTAIKVGFEPYYTVETYDKYDGMKSTVQSVSYTHLTLPTKA